MVQVCAGDGDREAQEEESEHGRHHAALGWWLPGCVELPSTLLVDSCSIYSRLSYHTNPGSTVLNQKPHPRVWHPPVHLCPSNQMAYLVHLCSERERDSCNSFRKHTLRILPLFPWWLKGEEPCFVLAMFTFPKPGGAPFPLCVGKWLMKCCN